MSARMLFSARFWNTAQNGRGFKCAAQRLYAFISWRRASAPFALLLASWCFAQTNQPPYREIDVMYSNPDMGNVDLVGTLTEPESGGPFPAVVLIAGAGQMDRDETIAGQKPFRALADYLTRRGIAVLRADKRGVHASMGQFESVTTKGFASDAEAAVRYLQTRSDIDPKQIGLIGHGEGAIEAVMVANDMPSIAFVVMLEGTGVPGEEVLLEQTERAEKAAGNMSKDQIKVDKHAGKMLYDLAKEGKSVQDMRLALGKYGYQVREEYDEDVSVAHWERNLNNFQSPWLRFFLSYDPAPDIAKLKCPVLALNGAKDMQVIADQNAPAIKAAMARGGNKDATVEILPGLNYLLQPANTGLAYEYASSPVAISPVALQKIGDWVSKHTHTNNGPRE